MTAVTSRPRVAAELNHVGKSTDKIRNDDRKLFEAGKTRGNLQQDFMGVKNFALQAVKKGEKPSAVKVAVEQGAIFLQKKYNLTAEEVQRGLSDINQAIDTASVRQNRSTNDVLSSAGKEQGILAGTFKERATPKDIFAGKENRVLEGLGREEKANTNLLDGAVHGAKADSNDAEIGIVSEFMTVAETTGFNTAAPIQQATAVGDTTKDAEKQQAALVAHATGDLTQKRTALTSKEEATRLAESEANFNAGLDMLDRKETAATTTKASEPTINVARMDVKTGG